MGDANAEPPVPMAPSVLDVAQHKPQAKIKATGRIGDVVAHDPSDRCLTYKLQFSDGAGVDVDWFAEDKVEVLPGVVELPRVSHALEAATSEEAAHLKAWGASRPAGTPINDEGFICMGSKAPQCPQPQEKQDSGPITLETLQGTWFGSAGAQIVVLGTSVHINGLALNGHSVELNEDMTVRSIGRLWQLQGWVDNGKIEFRCSSTREDMEYAKSEVWTPKQRNATQDSAESEKLRLLGYAGSAANPLARGIEGCMPGTTGAEMPVGYNAEKDAKEVALLTALVEQWREPELVNVPPWRVVPDATNRAQTGLGVELVHFIATSMVQKGFRKRHGTEGHDIPVVVREPSSSSTQVEALELWQTRAAVDDGFPPVRVTAEDELFTSLGNGHFFQALNLIACSCLAINDCERRYTVGEDSLLAEAISLGVPSIVLRHATPRPVRAKIAQLLNSKRDFMWTLGENGKVDTSAMKENTGPCSQFEWLSKGMDAFQVDCLVRTHLGIKDSRRIVG